MSARSTIDAAILQEIANTPKQGEVVSITEEVPYVFPGKVLKVDTLTFGPGGKLVMGKWNEPWIAIVAKTVKFSAPDKRAFIAIPTYQATAKDGDPLPDLGSAGQGAQGSPTNAGYGGGNGISGAKGNPGSVAPKIPHLYFLTDSIVRQSDNNPPDFVDLYFFVKGIDGGSGGIGQHGQHGGMGGSGGPSRWNGFTCDGGAGDGGRGGAAGAGGDGGDGQNGSDGGDITFGGTDAAIYVLEFSKVNSLPGRGGKGGPPGQNGSGGPGGPRGQRTGGCGGGGQGAPGEASQAIPKQGTHGEDGAQGRIYTSTIVVSDLF